MSLKGLNDLWPYTGPSQYFIQYILIWGGAGEINAALKEVTYLSGKNIKLFKCLSTLLIKLATISLRAECEEYFDTSHRRY